MTSGRKGMGFFRSEFEKAFRSQFLAAILEQLQQRPFAGEFHGLDDDLVFGTPRIGGQAAGHHHLHPVLGADGEARSRVPPADAVEDGVLVLEREIQMSGPGPLEPAEFAAHPNEVECTLDAALERVRDLPDRQYGLVVIGTVGVRMVRHSGEYGRITRTEQSDCGDRGTFDESTGGRIGRT